MVIFGRVPSESPIVLLFAIGMEVTIFLFYSLAVASQSFGEDKSAVVSNSKDGYKRFGETVREPWSEDI